MQQTEIRHMSHLTPELRDLAGAIRDQIKRIEGSAMALGRNLLRARQLANHGAWLPFLAAAGVSARTAQRLMRVVELTDAGKNPEGLPMTTLLEAEATPKQIRHSVAFDEGEDCGSCEDLDKRIAELEDEQRELRTEIEFRSHFRDDPEGLINALQAEIAAGKSTQATLQSDIAGLHRKIGSLYQRAAVAGIAIDASAE